MCDYCILIFNAEEHWFTILSSLQFSVAKICFDGYG